MESESPALEEGLIHDGSREATLRKWGDVGDEQALLWVSEIWDRGGVVVPVKHHSKHICSTIIGPTQAVVRLAEETMSSDEAALVAPHFAERMKQLTEPDSFERALITWAKLLSTEVVIVENKGGGSVGGVWAARCGTHPLALTLGAARRYYDLDVPIVHFETAALCAVTLLEVAGRVPWSLDHRIKATLQSKHGVSAPPPSPLLKAVRPSASDDDDDDDDDVHKVTDAALRKALCAAGTALARPGGW